MNEEVLLYGESALLSEDELINSINMSQSICKKAQEDLDKIEQLFQEFAALLSNVNICKEKQKLQEHWDEIQKSLYDSKISLKRDEDCLAYRRNLREPTI